MSHFTPGGVRRHDGNAACAADTAEMASSGETLLHKYSPLPVDGDDTWKAPSVATLWPFTRARTV